MTSSLNSALRVSTSPGLSGIALLSLLSGLLEVRLTLLSVGTTVSSRKLLTLVMLEVPAALVAMAVTVMVPSSSVPLLPTSLLARVIGCSLPVAVRVLLGRLWLLLSAKLSTTMAPDSALTVRMPLAAVASAAVAPPLATASGSVRVGGLGALESARKLALRLGVPVAALPAASWKELLKLEPRPTTVMAPLSALGLSDLLMV